MSGVSYFYQLQSNFNLGVTKRELLGAGVRFKPIRTKKIKYDFGLGIMKEVEEYQIDIDISNMFRITSMSIMKLIFESFELKNMSQQPLILQKETLPYLKLYEDLLHLLP